MYGFAKVTNLNLNTSKIKEYLQFLSLISDCYRFLTYFSEATNIQLYMNNFKYCPHCSSKNFEIENLHRMECLECGFIFYQNVAAAVAVIIEKNNHLLFTTRNSEPGKGMLDLPGGFTDPEETAEETCVRELKEELNLNFKTEDFTYFTSQPNRYKSHGILYRTEDLIFTARLPQENNIQLEKDEIKAIHWISKDQIELEKIAFDSLKKAVRQYLAQ